jgi:hypothetical protein
MIFTFFISAMVWLGLFIATDSGAEFLKIHNIIIGIPSYCLISFGCYALYEIGKGLSNLQDREEEYSNVLNDIKKAKEFLSSKGFFEK